MEIEAEIGYIPEDTAEELKHFSGDMAATISQIFAPSRDKTPGFRIDIWVSRNELKEADHIKIQ